MARTVSIGKQDFEKLRCGGVEDNPDRTVSQELRQRLMECGHVSPYLTASL